MLHSIIIYSKNILSQIPINDIVVNAIGSFLGWAGLLWLAMSKRGIRFLREKIERPSLRIELRKTPENIFTGIELGAPARWVEQQIGAPTKIGERWWGYRFSDSLLSICFDSNDSVKIISVALIDDKTTFDFPAWHFDCPSLGRLKLDSLLAAEHLSLEFKDSTRHSELFITGREGPRGAWHYIAFGVLSPHLPGPLLDVSFDWNKDENKLISQPKDIKINWAAVSNTSEIDVFPWDFGLTI